MSSGILAASKLKLPGTRVERSLAPDSQILCGVFVLLLFSPLAFGAVEPWAIFLLEAGSALLLCWWIYQQARTGAIQIRGNPLFAPMIAFAALVLIQVLFRVSAYAHDTISSAVLYLAYAMLAFLVSQTLHRSAQAKTIGCVISAYGFLLASFALLQGLSGTTRLYWIRTPRMGGWIYGPYVNHNHYAGMMELFLPFPLVICCARFGERWLRMAAMGTAALITGTIFLSGSRGGMLACAIQLCVLATFLLRAQRNPRSAVIIGAFLVITVGLLAWVGGGQLADRLGSIHTEARSELSGGSRWTLNKDSLHMATRKPILGWGLGTFPVVYPEFRSFYTNFFVNEAHDDYVQFLVETGAIGFAILLWFVWGLYRNALKKLENWTTDINGSIAMTCMLGCTGILVHSFLDFNLQIPANAAWFYVLAIVAGSPHAVEVRQRVRRLRRSHVDASVTETAPEGT